jgi:hypothetical protein
MATKFFYRVGCAVICAGLSLSVFAASPKDINYAGKGSSFGGGKYYIYSVRCSDGSKKVISAWDKRQKWCVGKKKKNCSKDQLQAAKEACK